MDPMPRHPAARNQHLAAAALGLLAFGAWLARHYFAGMDHDSVLYTLYALAKLHPDTVGWDAAVRFGSQDRFTLFTPLYTAAIQSLGVEHAAQLLVFLSQAAFLTGGWLLARRFMSALDATLGVALLIITPGEYGFGPIFHFLENFVTPRLAAEALVIFAVLAAVRQRYRIAAGFVLAAVLLHPIMGAAGAAFVLVTFLVPARPKLMLALATAAFTATLGIVVAIAPLGRLTDPQWMQAIMATSHYLFISTWPTDDWSRIAVPLAILTIGWRVGSTPQLRRICVGALVMVACGLLITGIFADLLHVWLFVTAQVWRWLWLADVLAFLLAPAIVIDCWQRSDSGRVAVMTLAGAWLFRGQTADFLVTGTAVVLAIVPEGWGDRRYWRLLFLGACVLVGLGLVSILADEFTYFPNAAPGSDVLLNIVIPACGDGVILGLVTLLTWTVLRRFTGNTAWPLTPMLLAALFCVCLIPHAWRCYTGAYYTPRLANQFAPWRAQIPPHAEVLWPDTALSAWYLLDRPNYWSRQQIAGGIFSQQQALLWTRRSGVIRTAMRNSNLLPRNGTPEEIAQATETMFPSDLELMDLKALRSMCGDHDLQYVVSESRLTETTLPPVVLDPSKATGTLHLYRCADLRH